MGTHAAIVVPTENSRLATYVHYDGYTDHMVPALLEAVARNGLNTVRELVKSGALDGGMRFFDSNINDIEFYRDTNQQPCDDVMPQWADYSYELLDQGLRIHGGSYEGRTEIPWLPPVVQGEVIVKQITQDQEVY